MAQQYVWNQPNEGIHIESTHTITHNFSTCDYGHSNNMDRIMQTKASNHVEDEKITKSMHILRINPHYTFIDNILEWYKYSMEFSTS